MDSSPNLLKSSTSGIGGLRSLKSRLRKPRLSKSPIFWILLPGVLIILALRIVPMLVAIFLSFTDTDLTHAVNSKTNLVGLSNYQTVLSSTDFWQAIGTTAWIVIPALIAEMFLGLTIALWLNRSFAGRNFMRGISLVPFLLVPVVIGDFFRMFYSAQFGELNYYLNFFGIHSHAWVTDLGTARWAIVAMEVWHTAPFVALLCLAGLSGIAREPIEAALMDGANSWQRFRYIVLPAIMPILGAILVLRAMDAIQIFDEIYVLTGGGPGRLTSVINLYLYQFGFSQFKIGQTSAAVSILVVSIVTLSCCGLGILRIRRKFEF